MGLHEALHVQSFATYGFPCKGLFVKDGYHIAKGAHIWWYDPGNDTLRAYSKHEILSAPSNPMSFSQVTSTVGTSTTTSSVVTTTMKEAMVANPQETLITYSYMIDDDHFASTPYPDEDESYYYNHSCTPNTAYRGDNLIVALRDIRSGEQVVYDYAYTETQDSLHYGMMCQCGSPHCRGRLDFLQYKDPTYIQQNYENCTSFIQRKMNEHGWTHNSVVRRHLRWDGATMQNDDAYGLFACQPIPSMTPILVFAGKVVSGEHVSQLSSREQEMSLQIADDLWQIPRHIRCTDVSCSSGLHRTTTYQLFFETGDYVNHSCQPTCGMMDAFQIMTIRDVAMHEELTIDYAMVNSASRSLCGDTFPCFCGSTNCRGTVTAQDYKMVGHRYLNYLSPFVKNKYTKSLVDDMTTQQLTITSSTRTSSSPSTSSTTSSFTIVQLQRDSSPVTSSFSDDEAQEDISVASTTTIVPSYGHTPP
jgi:SET domain